jgi:hypothetical protein
MKSPKYRQSVQKSAVLAFGKTTRGVIEIFGDEFEFFQIDSLSISDRTWC